MMFLCGTYMQAVRSLHAITHRQGRPIAEHSSAWAPYVGNNSFGFQSSLQNFSSYFRYHFWILHTNQSDGNIFFIYNMYFFSHRSQSEILLSKTTTRKKKKNGKRKRNRRDTVTNTVTLVSTQYHVTLDSDYSQFLKTKFYKFITQYNQRVT